MAIFITTAAYNISSDQLLLAQRYIEYQIALSKIFAYNIPVYGVVSETVGFTGKKVCNYFPFKRLVDIGNTNIYGKSRQEFYSLQQLFKMLEKDKEHIDENTLVFKASGRYCIVDDTFFINAIYNQHKYDAFVCKDKSPYNQMYTFYYAIKYKYLRDFYLSKTVHDITGNIEKHLLDYIETETKCKLNIYYANTLGILTNIANEDRFVIY